MSLKKELTHSDHLKLASVTASKRAQSAMLDGYDILADSDVTFILDLSVGNKSEIYEVIDILSAKGWIKGAVTLPKLDADGYIIDGEEYISGFTDVYSVIEADGYHGLLKANVLKACHWNDYPAWAKLPDGSPAHRWLGVDISGAPAVREMKKRRTPVPIIYQEEG